MTVDLEWIAGPRTGVSSKFIWTVMSGMSVADALKADKWGAWNYPSDPDDFSRCYLLLQRHPEWRERLPELAEAGPVWAALVAHWGELEALFLNIFDGSFTDADYDNRKAWNTDASELMYQRMKELEK